MSDNDFIAEVFVWGYLVKSLECDRIFFILQGKVQDEVKF